MNEKYVDIIRQVNQQIEAFNQHIDEKYHIQKFDMTRIEDDKYFVKVIHHDWHAFQWPNGTSQGVYFLLGFNLKDEYDKGLYIGKASFSSIGGRLYQHFHKHRENKHYVMNDAEGNVFTLEYIASIDMGVKNVPFLAPALEEFLIRNMKDSFHLLNATGNMN